MFTEYTSSLCNSHNTIIYWSKDIKKCLKSEMKKEPARKEQIEAILATLDLIINESRTAKKKGQRMENRLKAYRNSIEGLGFKRVYNKRG